MHKTTIVESQYHNFDEPEGYCKYIPLDELMKAIKRKPEDIAGHYDDMDKILDAMERIKFYTKQYDDLVAWMIEEDIDDNDIFDYIDPDDGDCEDNIITFIKQLDNISKKKKKYKNMLPKFYPGSIFKGTGSHARMDNYKGNSGIVLLDIDAQDNDDNMDFMVENFVYKDKYVKYITRSVSGSGWKIMVEVPPTETWKEYREISMRVCAYFHKVYNIKSDQASLRPSCGTYMFLDENIVVNIDSEIFTKDKVRDSLIYELGYASKPKVNFGNNSDIDVEQLSTDLVEDIYRAIAHSRIVDDYNTWVQCSKTIYDLFGKLGKNYFDIISYNGTSDYNNKKWDSFTKNRPKNLGIGALVNWVKKTHEADELMSRIKEEQRKINNEKGE